VLKAGLTLVSDGESIMSRQFFTFMYRINQLKTKLMHEEEMGDKACLPFSTPNTVPC
jgi:ribulose 1,5-bisphosphate carboxylase large subunit-like protein